MNTQADVRLAFEAGGCRLFEEWVRRVRHCGGEVGCVEDEDGGLTGEQERRVRRRRTKSGSVQRQLSCTSMHSGR